MQHLPHCGARAVPVFRWQSKDIIMLGLGVPPLESYCLDLSLSSANENLQIYITSLGLRALLCKIKVITVFAYRLF